MKYYQLDVEFRFSKNQDWSDQFPEKYTTLEEAITEAENIRNDIIYSEPVDDYLLGQDLPKDTQMTTFDYFEVIVLKYDDSDIGKVVYTTKPAIIELNK